LGSGSGATARAAYAGLMRQHQEAQLRLVLDQQQADTDAAMAAAYQQQQAAEQHFYLQQQEEQERRIKEERYHLQQLHQRHQRAAYFGPYTHPHPQQHSTRWR
jgi:hypothetical protein